MKCANNKFEETFYPVTEGEARDWYARKYINTTAYLLILKRFFTKPNADFVIPNVVIFCKEWGIAKSSFYRAVNTLSADGKITWEATQGIILKSHKKVVSIPRTGQCPTNGTVSHERDNSHEWDDSHDRDNLSHERDNSHEWDAQSHKRDEDIYIDRAHDRSISDLNQNYTDLIQISPLTPQGEKEGEGDVSLKVEVVPEEEELSTNFVASHRSSELALSQEKKFKSESKSSESCDNSEKLEQLLEDYDAGKITSIPKPDLRKLAEYMIGDFVKIYRASGRIFSSKPNDIDRNFQHFVAKKHTRGDLQNAERMIQNMEQEPQRWRILCDLVQQWQRSNEIKATGLSPNEFTAAAEILKNITSNKSTGVRESVR